jgi:hypothetical protein
MKDLSKHIKQAFGFWIVFSIGVWLSWNVFGYFEKVGSMPATYWALGIMGLTITLIGYGNSFNHVRIIAEECRRRIER